MNGEQMHVCFVDDEPETVQSVITELQAMRIFDVRYYKEYRMIPEDVVQNADLFVLDVWTTEKQTSDAFVRFVRSISRRKPFIAFTTAVDKSQLSLPSRDSVGLREFVLSHAGLCVVTKRDEYRERWKYEFRLDVLQKILWFYWTTRSA